MKEVRKLASIAFWREQTVLRKGVLASMYSQFAHIKGHRDIHTHVIMLIFSEENGRAFKF